MEKSNEDFWNNIPNRNVINKPLSSFYCLRFKIYEDVLNSYSLVVTKKL